MHDGEATLRASVADSARRYLGVPFHHGQMSEFGMDCVGLIRAVAQDMGFETPNPGVYSRSVYSRTTLGHVERFLVPGKGVVVGSVGLFFIPRLGRERPNHLSIFTNRGMVHATEQVKKVVEVSVPGEWLKCLHSTWDFPEVANWQP